MICREIFLEEDCILSFIVKTIMQDCEYNSNNAWIYNGNNGNFNGNNNKNNSNNCRIVSEFVKISI